MKTYAPGLAAVLALASLGVLAPNEGTAAQATGIPRCDARLRVELTPAVANPRDPGFISSLLENHPDYRLTVLSQTFADTSVVALELTGPASVPGCRAVIASMRKDARVASVTVQSHAVQPMGTVRAGPDGDWVLRRSSGVSYAWQAQVRYQCDIRAVDQTGFDPTAEDGGVAPGEFSTKRADYLRAEAACFEAHGYVMR